MIDQAKLPLLHSFPMINTGDPNEFRDRLAARFSARTVTIGDGAQPFLGRSNYRRFTNFDLSFSACTAPIEVSLPAVALIKQHFVYQKRGWTQFAGKRFTVSPSEAVVIPAGVDMVFQYDAGYELFAFRVSPLALQAKLSAIVGMPVTGRLEFATPSEFSNSALRRMRRLLEFAANELDGPTLPPAMFAEFEQLLLVAFLFGNPHNFSELLVRDQPAPAKWQVRVVEEYVEANWNRPITVEALASAADASARSVFKAFRDSRNCSPMAYVRSIRLAHARRMLQQPEPGTTVASVALACGFFNSGHFSLHYRLAFGEQPSRTLAASRRRI
jgi:AraC-like DNA-binding protein